MSASGDDGIIPKKTVRSFSDNYDGLGDVIESGLGGFLAAIFIGAVTVAQSLWGLFTTPVDRLATEIGGFLGSFVGGSGRIVSQGATTVVANISPGGQWAFLGPFTFPASILIVGAGLYAMSQVLAIAPTGNLIPFTLSDIPLVGVDEEEE
jgi:hypothetical protein